MANCRAETTRGRRCRNRVSGGGSYCWLTAHQHPVRGTAGSATGATEPHSLGLTAKQVLAVETIAAAAPGATQARLGKLCGVSRETVNVWLGNPTFIDALLDRRRQLSKLDYGKVLAALTREAIAGDVPAIRTWMEHHGQQRQKIELDATIDDVSEQRLLAALSAADVTEEQALAAAAALAGAP